MEGWATRVGVQLVFSLGRGFYWLWKASQLKTIQIYFSVVRSLVWIGWLLDSGFHVSQVKVAAGFIPNWRIWGRTCVPAQAGCCLGSFPDGRRTEAPVSLLAVSHRSVLEFPGSPHSIWWFLPAIASPIPSPPAWENPVCEASSDSIGPT